MSLDPKMLIRLALLAAVGPLILMLAGGDAGWVMGWVFSIFSFVYALAGRLLILRHRPDLVTERAEAMKKDNVEDWDRKLVPLIAIYLPTAMIVTAGLDHRFGWTRSFPPWLEVAAYGPLILGAAIAQWAVMENAFFSAVVRIQAERGQTVVTTGPYRFVRHPGYLGGMLFNFFIPLALGSLWACLPMALLLTLTAVRTRLEDRTLIAKLPGYRDYADRTRRRLLPLVW
jgi:protein-S-isoprenylcysteine O-methyltransferase Ste14